MPQKKNLPPPAKGFVANYKQNSIKNTPTFFKFIHANFLEKHDEWMLLKIIQMMIKRWTESKRKQFTFKGKVK